jgi:hypothetical protein
VLKRSIAILPGLLTCIACVTTETSVFHESFSSAKALPAEFTEFNGKAGIGSSNGNRYAELPAKPASSHGLLFGPALSKGLRVEARFLAEDGEKSPTFAVGLNGLSGYRLQINPNKQQLELLRNEVVVHTEKFEWLSEKWTHLQLQVRELPGLQWIVEGKAWHENQAEPKKWSLQWKDTAAPNNGQPSVWGTPYAVKPIALDDVRLRVVE